ncbi:MAG: RNHCP domain-containing protein [bacterium]|nr:RNHCP domain-containing protein [bacterium]
MKRFQRKIEDFTCEHCGEKIIGDGYTNHCPHCLWSKHVDVNPGDRGSACGGMMKPVRIEGTVAAYFIIHKCIKCGVERRNIFGKKDSIEAMLDIAKNSADEIAKRAT